MEIPTRNILMSKRHYGQVVKIFALGYKDRGFGSPHVHVCTKKEFKRPRLNGGKKLFFLDLIYEGQKKAERFCYYKINEMGKFFFYRFGVFLYRFVTEGAERRAGPRRQGPHQRLFHNDNLACLNINANS